MQSGRWITVNDCKNCNDLTKMRTSLDTLWKNGMFLIMLWYTSGFFYAVCHCWVPLWNTDLCSTKSFLKLIEGGQKHELFGTNLYIFIKPMWFHWFDASENTNSPANNEQNVHNFKYISMEEVSCEHRGFSCVDSLLYFLWLALILFLGDLYHNGLSVETLTS